MLPEIQSILNKLPAASFVFLNLVYNGNMYNLCLTYKENVKNKDKTIIFRSRADKGRHKGGNMNEQMEKDSESHFY